MIAVRGIEAATGLRPDGGEISGMITGVRIITGERILYTHAFRGIDM